MKRKRKRSIFTADVSDPFSETQSENYVVVKQINGDSELFYFEGTHVMICTIRDSLAIPEGCQFLVGCDQLGRRSVVPIWAQVPSGCIVYTLKRF